MGSPSPRNCSFKKATTASPPFVAFNPGGIATVLIPGIILLAMASISICCPVVHWLESICEDISMLFVDVGMSTYKHFWSHDRLEHWPHTFY
jgi:hypothetical protein